MEAGADNGLNGDGVANTFLIVSTEPQHTMPKEPPEVFADYIRVSDKACLVLARGFAPTTKDVSEAIGIGPPPSGVTGVAVSVDAYYGYETPTGERIASLEAHMQHMATREDIQRNAKNNLRWLVTIMITSLIAAVAATAAVTSALVGSS